MKYFKFYVFPGLLIALLGAAIAFFIDISKDQERHKVRYIDKWVNIVHTNVDESELEEKNVQILYKGRSINSFTQIKVQLFNFTGTAFKNISVYVEITPEPGDSLELMESDITGPNGVYEAVSRIEEGRFRHTVKGSLKYGYLIPLANRTDSMARPMLNCDYTVLSGAEPKVIVTMISSEEDLLLTPYIHEHFEKPSIWENNGFLLLFFVLVMIILVYLEVSIIRIFARKRNERFRTYLKKCLRQKIDRKELTLEAEDIIKTYKMISDSFEYDDSWEITKVLKRMQRPEDYCGEQNKNL